MTFKSWRPESLMSPLPERQRAVFSVSQWRLQYTQKAEARKSGCNNHLNHIALSAFACKLFVACLTSPAHEFWHTLRLLSCSSLRSSVCSTKLRRSPVDLNCSVRSLFLCMAVCSRLLSIAMMKLPSELITTDMLSSGQGRGRSATNNRTPAACPAGNWWGAISLFALSRWLLRSWPSSYTSVIFSRLQNFHNVLGTFGRGLPGQTREPCS